MNGQNAPEASFKRLVLQGLVAGSVIGLCLGLGLSAAEYIGLYVTRFSVMIFAGFFWICMPVFALLLLLTIMRRFRPTAVLFLSAELGTLTVSAVAVLPSVNLAHTMVLDHEMQHARPIIEALKSYQMESSRPATGLGQLMPKYGETPPMPARQACHYHYEITAIGQTPEESNQDLWKLPNDQKSWQFSIECPADWLFDVEVLVYRSDSQYEAVEYAWKQHSIGDWMYYYFRD